MYELLLVNKNLVKTTFDNDFSLYVVDCVLLARRTQNTDRHSQQAIRYSEANRLTDETAPAPVYFSTADRGRRKNTPTTLSLCRQGNEMRHSLFALSEYCC